MYCAFLQEEAQVKKLYMYPTYFFRQESNCTSVMSPAWSRPSHKVRAFSKAVEKQFWLSYVLTY